MCGADSDKFGDHATVCGGQRVRIVRHNHLRDVLLQTAQSADLAPRREERAILSGNNNRPADVFIPGWAGGKPAALDVTVVSPLLEAMVVLQSALI